jgi:nicotinamidase-related amidase
MHINEITGSALLVIDVQQGFDDPKWGNRNNPDAEKNIARLLEFWRSKNWPVIHVQHNSTDPDSPLRPERSGNKFKESTRPLENEKIIGKNVHSAFIGTDLESYLREHGIKTLIITGLTTNHCVSTTTRMSGNLGFTTYLVSDATATFDREGPHGEIFRAEDIHKISLANLHGEFATVVCTKDIVN